MSEISFAYTNPLRTRFSDEYFSEIPQVPGVYIFLDAKKKPLYIGKADNLKRRLMSYRAAKPGQVAEHTLEMLEHTEALKWERHESGDKALLRESALIRTIKPPFNIAGTYPIQYLFCGIRMKKKVTGPYDLVPVDFRLSHHCIQEGRIQKGHREDEFLVYGCFPHRGKTKAGYSALLRLFFAVTCEREKFHLPAKLCRTSPAYVHTGMIPGEWIEPLKDFLAGKNSQLLRKIMSRLLEKENLSPYLYAPLQRDLQTAEQFFVSGPKSLELILRRERIKKTVIDQEKMEKILAKSMLKDFDRCEGLRSSVRP